MQLISIWENQSEPHLINSIEPISIGISRVGNGDGSDLCLEIFANHKAVPLFRVEWGHPKLCQVPSFYSNSLKINKEMLIRSIMLFSAIHFWVLFNQFVIKFPGS